MRAPSTPTNALTAVLAAAGGLMGRIFEARDRRRVVRTLASFDDHMLRDIGLTRFDLDAALVEPMLADPTLILAGRADELRDHRRALTLEARSWAAQDAAAAQRRKAA